MTPKEAYYHACNVGRYPEGESAIAESCFFSYMYARYIIGRRFLLGEASIVQNALYAFFYARDVICGRWPEGEAIIRNSVHYGEYNHICGHKEEELEKADWREVGF